MDNFWLFVILIYDIHNKISKLDLFGHFCLWPLLASFRGHWKTFMLRLIQRWFLERFEVLMKGLHHTQNDPKITNSFCLGNTIFQFLTTPRFWPQQRLHKGWVKTFWPDMMQLSLNITHMKFKVFLWWSMAHYREKYAHFESTFAPCRKRLEFFKNVKYISIS